MAKDQAAADIRKRRPAGAPKRRLTEEQVQARAELMLLRTLQLKTTRQIQEEFGICAKTVYEGLALARKQGMYTAAKDRVLGSLVPRSVLVLEEILMDPEASQSLRASTAQDILTGVGMLSKHGTVTILQGEDTGGGSFEDLREKILNKQLTAGEGVVDVVVQAVDTEGVGEAGRGDDQSSVAPEGEADVGQGAGEGGVPE